MFCPECGEKVPQNSKFCLFCGAPLEGDAPQEPARTCTVCGRELPESSVSDICVTCLYNRNYVAEPVAHSNEEDDFVLPSFDDFPEEEAELPLHPPSKKADRLARMAAPAPKAPRDPGTPRQAPSGKFPLRLLLFPALLLLVIALALMFILRACAAKPKDPKPGGNSAETSSASQSMSSSKVDPREEDAVAAAQAMVKKEARNPASVYFDAKTLSASDKGGEYTVTQLFEREGSKGELIKADYVAILRLDATATGGYVPIFLQVGDNVLYDHGKTSAP